MYFLINSLRGNGAEKVLVTLLKNIPSSEKIVLFLLKNEIDLLVPPNVTIISLEQKKITNNKMINVLYSTYKLYRYIKLKKVVLNSFLFESNLINILLKMMGSKHKAIVHEHSVPSNVYEKKILIKILYKLIYKKADKIITVSKGVEKEINYILKSVKNEGKIEVIYNPVDVEEIQKKSLEPSNYSNELPYVVAVGRLEKIKQFDLLVENFPTNSKYSLLIIGKGPEKENIQKKIKDRGLEGKIILTGWTANPYPLIKNSKALLVTSRFESFSMVIIESICCYTPVVSFDCNYGPKELLENNKFGAIISENDWVSFYEEVDKKVQNNISWENSEVNDYLKNYKIETVFKKYQNKIVDYN